MNPRCGHDGGQGIGAGHTCTCVRLPGHSLTDYSGRPHGCSCGALWGDTNGQKPTATPVHDPGLDHLLEEVAAEVLRQDAAGGMSYTRDGEWLANRTYSVQRAAHAIRSMRAIDMAAGGEQA